MLTQVSPLLYAWRTHTYRGTCVLVTLHLKSNYAHCTYATWAKQHCWQLAARCSRRCRALPFESYLAAGQTWCFSFSIFLLLLLLFSFCEHTTNSNDSYISSMPLLLPLSLFLPCHLPILHHQANRQAGSCLSFWLPPQPTLSEDILLCVL